MIGFVQKPTGYIIGKTEHSLLDYSLDWSDVLELNESIVSATWSVATGLTASLPSISNAMTTVWLSGGTLDAQYGVACVAITSANRQYERGFFVKIQTPQRLSLP